MVVADTCACAVDGLRLCLVGSDHCGVVDCGLGLAMAGSRAVRDSEKEAERDEAQKLAQRTGVPLWGAFRVIRGEVSLNELLKSMMRREKFQRLQKGGLDPDLAGHVASGSLPEWRANVLQEMRTAGRAKFTRDRIEMAHREKLPIAIWAFGHDDWQAGSITKARTYDFNFLPDSGDENSTVFKHDVKMICHPDDLATLQTQRRFDKRVLNEGLGASRERKDRYRPTDEELSGARSKGKDIRWVFRDGTGLDGRVLAFGRWDVDIVVGGENGEFAPATVFFHALHPATAKQIQRVIR